MSWAVDSLRSIKEDKGHKERDKEVESCDNQEKEAMAQCAFRPALLHPSPLEAGKSGLFLYL